MPVLGRMLTRTDDATGANPQVSTWVYDTAAKGIGKPGSVSGYGYAASIAYDALGRPAHQDGDRRRGDLRGVEHL